MATAIDFFCGAGGSSTGMVAAGVEVKMAVNHWQRAIETHSANHTHTDHDCVDIRMVHPSAYPKTDIFWSSPECTNHSISKGRKRKNLNQLDLWGGSQVDPEEERSRATMREVIDFAEYHRNPIVIVENVVDIRYWQHYEAWLQAMVNLGYQYRTLYLNAQFFGVPQSRDRWYTVFWLASNHKPNLDFTPTAFCQRCERQVQAYQSFKKASEWGRYGKNRQYTYRCPHCHKDVEPFTIPAAAAIDWSLAAERIGDRKTPLKPKTLERIKTGLKKFAQHPIVVDTAFGTKASSTQSVLPTQTTRQTFALAVPPFLMSYYSREFAASRVDEPIPVIPTENRHSLIIPPFTISVNHSSDRIRDAREPFDTVMPQGNPGVVIAPAFIAELRHNSTARSVEEPLSTITTSGAHHGLAFLTSYYGNEQSSPVTEPIPTVTTVDRHGLVEPEDLLEDCKFRMLQPHELKRGMSFPDQYIITGNKREQVKQVGNAVCCNVAEWIVRRCVESLQ